MNWRRSRAGHGIGSSPFDAGAELREVPCRTRSVNNPFALSSRVTGAGCSANRRVVIERCSEIGKKIAVVRQCNCTPEISSCHTLQLCNDGAAAVHYRGFIKVDEVDSRSPVERAAATFVPDLRGHCAGHKTKSAAEFLHRAQVIED